MSLKFKGVLLFLKLTVALILSRSFGSIIYDVANKYDGKVSIQDLRKFAKMLDFMKIAPFYNKRRLFMKKWLFLAPSGALVFIMV